MFPNRFFNERFYAARYFPKVGSSAADVYGPLSFSVEVLVVHPTSQPPIPVPAAENFVPGALEIDIELI